MDGKAHALELKSQRRGQNGSGTLSQRIDAGDVAINAGNRETFAQALCDGGLGLSFAEVHEKLFNFVSDDRDGRDDRPPQSKATLLVELVNDAELFHSPEGEAYASISVNGHRETHAVASKGFRQWLEGQFWKKHRKAAGSQAMGDAVSVIRGMAMFEGPAHPVAVRVARYGEAIYLDLGDAAWRAVEITADGWTVVNDTPVKFLRPGGMYPLPMPVSGGTIDELRRFINVGSDANWYLLVAWLAATLRPEGPFPILAINGEKGSAKSTLCRMVRALIDPNQAPLRAEPRGNRDLMIAATNSWLTAFDNLSQISPSLSDALCRLSTGGGFGTRKLCTNDEEKLFNGSRPIMFNGIEDVATRPDLLQRCICLTLPTIPEEDRRTEAELWPEFEKARPRILGALLNAVSSAMRNLSMVKGDKWPRMADFAKWGVAAESALGLPEGAFLDACSDNGRAANDLAIDASPIGQPILNLMEGRVTWEGTTQQLLAALTLELSDMGRPHGWPRNARDLAGQLQCLVHDLRNVSVEVIIPTKRTNRGRMITLEKTRSSQPSQSSP